MGNSKYHMDDESLIMSPPLWWIKWCAFHRYHCVTVMPEKEISLGTGKFEQNMMQRGNSFGRNATKITGKVESETPKSLCMHQLYRVVAPKLWLQDPSVDWDPILDESQKWQVRLGYVHHGLNKLPLGGGGSFAAQSPF